MLLVFDRGTLKQVFPQFGFAPEDAETLAHHLVQYALAGLGAVAAEGRKDLPQPPSSSSSA
jgi:hypothetical protein